MILNWGELITLEYGKPVKDKESTDGKIPVYGTNGQINANTLLLFWGEKAHIEGYIIRIVHFL